VGIAIYFCVKKRGVYGCRIWYEAARDYARAEEKSEFIGSSRREERRYRELIPTSDGHWIALDENQFSALIPLATDSTKMTRIAAQEQAIFKLFLSEYQPIATNGFMISIPRVWKRKCHSLFHTTQKPRPILRSLIPS
jgi:hypothetical protein